MRAVVLTEYKQPLELIEVEEPQVGELSLIHI